MKNVKEINTVDPVMMKDQVMEVRDNIKKKWGEKSRQVSLQLENCFFDNKYFLLTQVNGVFTPTVVNYRWKKRRQLTTVAMCNDPKI